MRIRRKIQEMITHTEERDVNLGFYIHAQAGPKGFDKAKWILLTLENCVEYTLRGAKCIMMPLINMLCHHKVLLRGYMDQLLMYTDTWHDLFIAHRLYEAHIGLFIHIGLHVSLAGCTWYKGIHRFIYVLLIAKFDPVVIWTLGELKPKHKELVIVISSAIWPTHSLRGISLCLHITRRKWRMCGILFVWIITSSSIAC